MKRNGPIRKIWAAFCKRKNLDSRSVTFLFNGHRLRAEQTPDELNMNDHDEIDAMKPMLDGRDWNELPVHCLVEETIPLVCKTWCDATFYPQCWQRLVFTRLPYLRSSKHSVPRLELGEGSRLDSKFVLPCDLTSDANDCLEMFLHFAIGRSNGLVTEVVFHPCSRLKEGQIAWMAQQ
ncbi:F-box domain, Leucine-rich repeat domain, L domain-like protein [Artemisia annua]|nr:F-box domain, Leucine-rich repeat domain, L domain-like protein [Artemisia annua]